MRMLKSLSPRRVDARLIAWARNISIVLIALVCASPAIAEKGKLRERLTPDVMAIVYPAGAERLGPGQTDELLPRELALE